METGRGLADHILRVVLKLQEDDDSINTLRGDTLYEQG